MSLNVSELMDSGDFAMSISTLQLLHQCCTCIALHDN